MQTTFVEVEHDFNWGKFAVGRFDTDEWARTSGVGTQTSLLKQRGWTLDHIWVFDLQTGEAAYFRPGGIAQYDLNKHKIWVCPMFQPFLQWLYQQDLSDLTKLPKVVKLTEKDAPGAMYGYRRKGSTNE